MEECERNKSLVGATKRVVRFEDKNRRREGGKKNKICRKIDGKIKGKKCTKELV